MNNCRILELYVCDPAIREFNSGLCPSVRGRISLAERDPKLKVTIDHGCAHELRVLASQAR